MTRKGKLFLNTTLSISYKVVSLVCAFILPRAILSHYGSVVNGLTQSIEQFLGFISMLEMGVTSVVDANLYKPLASADYDKVNDIFVSAEKFFRRIALCFVVYVFFLIIIYPFSVSDYFSYSYTGLLIVIIAASTFSQYYFGISYRIVINADQRGYFVTIIQGITIILNTLISVFLIKHNTPIHIVKLSATLLYLIQPICFHIYAKRIYGINSRKIITGEPIKQKWNGFAQHVAFIVATKTDTIVLTLFSTLTNVSIYGVYALVLSGITSFFDAIYIGISPMIGNIIANNEKEKLNEVFDIYDWFSHYLTTLLFSLCGILIVPFVRLYTIGINDANYEVPMFAVFLTIAHGVQILRTPYKTVVQTAGHFKQTQTSAVIEAVLNLSISICVVFKFGLIGVAIGTLVSMAYRTIYLAWYLSNNILYRAFRLFLRSIIVDIIDVLLIVFPALFIKTSITSFFDWFKVALGFGMWGLTCTIGFNFLVNKKVMINAIKTVRKKAK